LSLPRPHLGLLLLVLGLPTAGCRAPALERPAFAFLAPGSAGLVFKQPLYNDHDLTGEFDVGPVADPLGGPPNFFFVEDEGEVLGKYEASLGARGTIAQDTTLELGLGYRLFEIEGLQPAPDPSIRFVIEAVDSLQFFAALRRYFRPPVDLGPRWRLFGEVGLFVVPGITVDSRLEFLTTVKPISSDGETYRFLGLTGGTAYQWSDHLVLELGLTWEEPLEELLVDLSTSVDFGGGQVVDVPIAASMEPRGAVAFLSFTWYP
jgi:hypothetical protein